MVKNLEYIARSAQFYLRKTTDNDFAYFLQCAKRAYTEILPHDGLKRLKCLYFSLDHLSRLGLPEDFIMYTNIGVMMGNRVWPLTLDPTIAIDPVPACLEGLSETDNANNDTGAGVYPYLYSVYGSQYTPFTAGGANNYGYYRPNLEEGIIYFDSTLRDHVVVLEYISNGGDVNGSTRVMEAYVTALIDYVMWQDIEHNMTIPMQERERRKDAYMISRENAYFNANAPLIQEVLDAIYLNSGDKFR